LQLAERSREFSGWIAPAPLCDINQPLKALSDKAWIVDILANAIFRQRAEGVD
jgi:hypothetical protein